PEHEIGRQRLIQNLWIERAHADKKYNGGQHRQRAGEQAGGDRIPIAAHVPYDRQYDDRADDVVSRISQSADCPAIAGRRDGKVRGDRASKACQAQDEEGSIYNVEKDRYPLEQVLDRRVAERSEEGDAGHEAQRSVQVGPAEDSLTQRAGG